MNTDIKHNDSLDEFAYDLSLVMRLENYINNHFYPAYVISKLSPIYLVGGSIRDLIYAKTPKDMDFVVLGEEQLSWIKKVLETFNIDYKFVYKDIEIDLWIAEDLFSSMQYNVDGLYFDLRTNYLISLTLNDFIKRGLRLTNDENNIENDRVKKLRKFEDSYLKNVTYE